jgi:hypothetical protein
MFGSRTTDNGIAASAKENKSGAALSEEFILKRLCAIVFQYPEVPNEVA